MTRTYRGDRKAVTVSNGGVAVSAGATSFTVASSAITDFPGPGSATFEVQSTGESIEVTAGLGTTSWSGIVRGVDHTTAAVIPDGSILLEIEGAVDYANFLQRDETALPTSMLSTTTPLVAGTAAIGTSTKAARADHVHPAAGAGAADATTTTVGVVEVDHAPSGAHPIALTEDGLALPSGMLGATAPAADGTGAAGTAVQASRSDHVHPTVDATTSTPGMVEVDHAPSGAHPVALTTDGTSLPAGMIGTTSTKAAAGNAVVSSIKKTGSAALIGAVTLTGGTNVTLTQSGQDISIAASGGASAATTSVLGTVEVDNSMGGTPVAVTTASRGVASGIAELTSQTRIPAAQLPAGSANIDPTAVEGDIIYRHVPTAVVIGFIGDSITANTPSGGSTPPANTVADLTTLIATASNQGVSGKSSTDWLPSNGAGPYAAAKAAFISAGVSVVHIMLGTVDSDTAVRTTQSAYKSNIAALCADLNAAGMICVLSYSSYVVPGSGSGLYDATSDTLLVQYQTAIDQLVNGTTIRQGDTLAYAYFQGHTSELSDGIHPTATGSTHFGTFWSAALAPIVTCPLKRLPVGAAGTYARSNGTDPVYSAILAGDLPLATTGAFGAVKPDGTSITISAGVISSVGGGSATHSESLTDGASNFVFARGDIVTVVGVPN